jgi:hypothetical protein
LWQLRWGHQTSNCFQNGRAGREMANGFSPRQQQLPWQLRLSSTWPARNRSAFPSSAASQIVWPHYPIVNCSYNNLWMALNNTNTSQSETWLEWGCRRHKPGWMAETLTGCPTESAYVNLGWEIPRPYVCVLDIKHLLIIGCQTYWERAKDNDRKKKWN